MFSENNPGFGEDEHYLQMSRQAGQEVLEQFKASMRLLPIAARERMRTGGNELLLETLQLRVEDRSTPALIMKNGMYTLGASLAFLYYDQLYPKLGQRTPQVTEDTIVKVLEEEINQEAEEISEEEAEERVAHLLDPGLAACVPEVSASFNTQHIPLDFQAWFIGGVDFVTKLMRKQQEQPQE
jgi:hypothetical protein